MCNVLHINCADAMQREKYCSPFVSSGMLTQAYSQTAVVIYRLVAEL
jgi:hypothetical protein